MGNFAGNLQDGIIIMFIGMGVAFAFLTIMVFVMGWMSKLVIKLNEIFPEQVVEEKYTKKQVKNDDNDIALAIAVALSQR